MPLSCPTPFTGFSCAKPSSAFYISVLHSSACTISLLFRSVPFFGVDMDNRPSMQSSYSYAEYPIAAPQKHYPTAHSTSSAFSASANPNEDWTKASARVEEAHIIPTFPVPMDRRRSLMLRVQNRGLTPYRYQTWRKGGEYRIGLLSEIIVRSQFQRHFKTRIF